MAHGDAINHEIDTNRKLVRYKRALDRSRMPATRKQLALKHYADALALEEELAEACLEVIGRRGTVRPGARRAIRAMARGLVGITRHEPREHWAELMAEAGALRVRRGLDQGLVWDCLVACWAHIGNGTGAPVPEELAERFQGLVGVKTPAGKPAVVPVPAEAATTRASSGVRKRMAGALAKAAKRSDEEAAQERHAADHLRLALQRYKPWARQVVVDRMVEQMPDEELARKHSIPVELVRDVIEVARKTVHRYTLFFDSETWWEGRPQAVVDTEAQGDEEQNGGQPQRHKGHEEADAEEEDSTQGLEEGEEETEDRTDEDGE